MKWDYYVCVCVCVCLKERDRGGLLSQLQASAQQKAFQKHIHPVFAAAHTDTASKAVKTPSPCLCQHNMLVQNSSFRLLCIWHIIWLTCTETNQRQKQKENQKRKIKKKTPHTARTAPAQQREKRAALTSHESSSHHFKNNTQTRTSSHWRRRGKMKNSRKKCLNRLAMSILGFAALSLSLCLSRPLLSSHCSCRVIPLEHPESWADNGAGQPTPLTMWSR